MVGQKRINQSSPIFVIQRIKETLSHILVKEEQEEVLSKR